MFWGISLKNKLITCSILLLTLLLLPNISNANTCNNKTEINTCVQVFVKSKTGQELGDLVVYLEPLDGQILDKSHKEVVVGQRDKSFTPYITVSQTNSKVNFVNQDNITHHIYSAESENKFSFKIRAGTTHSLTQFDQANEIAMGCNIHDWMSGYLLVVNTPYFDKTDELGQVSFNLAKKGKYKVVVWHPQMQAENNRMIMEQDITKHNTFTFTLKNELESIPTQESDDDFEFLSDY